MATAYIADETHSVLNSYVFQIGKSRNTKCAIWIGFPKAMQSHLTFTRETHTLKCLATMHRLNKGS